MARSCKTEGNLPSLNCLYINPTKYCNLMCKHCWIAPGFMKTSPPRGETDLRLIKKSMREGIKLGLTSIKLTGGEPLLSKDVIKIIKYARGKKLGVSIESNGTLIDRKMVDLLEKLKVAFVSVSLDSTTAGLHDDFRCVKGSFNAAVTGLKNLVKHKIPNQIIFSLTRKNKNELFKMPAFAKKLGAGSLKINVISPIARAKVMQKKGELLSIRENIEIYKKFEKRFSTNKTKKLRVFYDIPHVFKSLDVIKDRSNLSRCTIHNILGILPDGLVSICGIGFIIKDTILGDLSRQSLKDIWENAPFLKKIRKDIPKNLKGVCASCLFKNLCLGKCLAQTVYETKKHNLPFSFCDQAQKEGLFPRSRTVPKSWLKTSNKSR